MSNDDTPKRFRPERPINLNEENTGLKNKDEVLLAIMKLRNEKNELGSGRHWLCAYSEKARPLHMSFNNHEEFQEFKRDCNTLKIKLKQPIIKDDDLEESQVEETKPSEATARNTYTDPDGKVHVEK